MKLADDIAARAAALRVELEALQLPEHVWESVGEKFLEACEAMECRQTFQTECPPEEVEFWMAVQRAFGSRH